MQNQPWFNRLESELQRRGLPRAYIARYLSELNDHFLDLLEEREIHMSKDARQDDQVSATLGDPATLAEAATIEFNRRTFCGRHPLVTFLLMPIPLAVLAWAAAYGLMFACAAAAGLAAEWVGAAPDEDFVAADWPAVLVWGCPILFVLGAIVPPACLTVLYCRMAQRSGLSWRWSLTGCLLVAIIAGMFQAQLELPVVSGGGRVIFGFGAWYVPPVRQMLQFALPLTIGLGLLWHQVRARETGPVTPRVDPVLKQAA